MMERTTQTFTDLGVVAQVSTFADESHVILHVEGGPAYFLDQLNRLHAAEARLSVLGQAVMKRYFLSDAANQAPLVKCEGLCSVSLIQQSPLDGSKVGVWIYYIKDADLSRTGGTVAVNRGSYRHLWTMGMASAEGDAAAQTHALLRRYAAELSTWHATLPDNCVRTWFFVRDVDIQYAGMVKARREDFITYNLTPQTHYIASTGIGGTPAEAGAIVQFGAYAITGLQPGQQQYLYARTHLNPTYEYGVTFERGVKISYGDRDHVYISGTASINNRGEVVHAGDVMRQTQRMWENVGALLQEGGCGADDIAQIIVYLRDVADYATVEGFFHDHALQIPYIITLAPVCRPAWLVEMECIAIKARTNSAFKNF